MERKGEAPTLKRVAQGKEGREQWARESRNKGPQSSKDS